MWKIDKPAFDTRMTYKCCISRIRNPAFKSRLELIEDDIVQASEEYDNAAGNVALHIINSSDNVGGHVTKEEMAKIYNYRMAQKGAPGRYIYDELLTNPIHGLCPLCGHRDVTTIDHHLPKAHYPSLTVTPINLVPSCSECNKTKNDVIPTSRAELTIHPYYDDFQGDRWLYSEVIQDNPAGVRFFVSAPDHWSEVTATRVHKHFELLKLEELYATQAARVLADIRFYLKKLFESAGAEAVCHHLNDMAETRKNAFINSWQTAAYEAFAQSEWFCEGGFLG